MTKKNHHQPKSSLQVDRKIFFLPIESSFIWTVVKHLQELTTTKMEHELRINAEVIRQYKANRVFFSIIGKLLTKSNQHAI